MGPNILCYVTRHFLFCPYVALSLFIRPWRHFTCYMYNLENKQQQQQQLSTVFIKGNVWLLQLLKWPCRTSFFTDVEPYYSLHVLTHQNLCDHMHMQFRILVCMILQRPKWTLLYPLHDTALHEIKVQDSVAESSPYLHPVSLDTPLVIFLTIHTMYFTSSSSSSSSSSSVAAATAAMAAVVQ